MGENYYDILGVDKNATKEEIKKAYKTLSKKHHPDMGGDENQFKKINEAYSILSDDSKKEKYDNPRVDSFFDPFRNESNYRGEIYRPGKNIRLNINLTLEDVLNGITKKIKYNRDVKCDTCNGHGGTEIDTCKNCNGTGVEINIQKTPYGVFQTATTCHNCQGSGKTYKNECKTCNGTGTKHVEEIKEIKIPRGVETGMGLSFDNSGSFVKNASDNGKLILAITVQKHPVFDRTSNNLTMNIGLDYTDLVLGVDKNIITIDNKNIKINVPKLTKPNSSLRIRGFGLYDVNDSYGEERGDLIINVSLNMPKEVNKEDEELLLKLKKY